VLLSKAMSFLLFKNLFFCARSEISCSLRHINSSNAPYFGTIELPRVLAVSLRASYPILQRTPFVIAVFEGQECWSIVIGKEILLSLKIIAIFCVLLKLKRTDSNGDPCKASYQGFNPRIAKSSTESTLRKSIALKLMKHDSASNNSGDAEHRVICSRREMF
jgi:hypothetical protein